MSAQPLTVPAEANQAPLPAGVKFILRQAPRIVLGSMEPQRTHVRWISEISLPKDVESSESKID